MTIKSWGKALTMAIAITTAGFTPVVAADPGPLGNGYAALIGAVIGACMLAYAWLNEGTTK